MADSNLIFAYDNLIDSATLTASAEDDSLPVENIQDAFRTEVWQGSSLTGTFNIVIDHGSAKAVTTIAIINYSWDSEPTTFDLEFNATDSWASPSVTEALTDCWVANPDSYGNRSCIFKTFNSHSYRYNRLNIVHADANPQIGRIFLGTNFIPSRNFQMDHSFSIVDPSIVSKTADGQGSTDLISKYRAVDFGFRFSRSEYSEIQKFHKMINNVGIGKDLFVAFDYTNYPSEKTLYGKFTDIGFNQPFAHTVSIKMEESV